MFSKNPFLLIFFQPRKAVKIFLKKRDYKNTAMALALLMVFCSLVGTYPKNIFIALTLITIQFISSFLYVYFIYAVGKSTKKTSYWQIYGSIYISVLPMIVGMTIFFISSYSIFGSSALYDGLKLYSQLPQSSPSAFVLSASLIIGTTWTLIAECQTLSEIQGIASWKAFWKIILFSFLTTFLTSLIIYPLIRAYQ